MFRRIISCGGLLLLAGVVLLVSPDFGWARGVAGGGARFGGAYFGGARIGGYRGGYYRGGYRYGYRPYYGYGYGRGYYGGYPYFGYGYYPYYDTYPYDGLDAAAAAGYGRNNAEPAPAYPDYSTSATPPSYQAYYDPATAMQPPDAVTRITVNVPADAQIWFNDTLTTFTGPVRQFDSPPLLRGSRYVYDVKATWNQNGHEVSQTQKVEFTAGVPVAVSFPVPSRPAENTSTKTSR